MLEMPRVCRTCHAELPNVTVIFDEGPPKPGDISICHYCMELAIFTENGLREPTDEEWKALGQNEDLTTALRVLEGLSLLAGEDTVNRKAEAEGKVRAKAIPIPELVRIEPGTFLMGSPEPDNVRYPDETPQHEVAINYSYSLGRYPVTFEEYDYFCVVTGRAKPSDRGWGRSRRPAINVSWRDVMAYCEWMAKETGKPYRLPSEAEWEYACRVGSATRYAFGDEITDKDANFNGNIGKITEVGAYPPNPWGLCDMHGNVWEWVEDVWHEDYLGAPADGSAWIKGEGIDSSRARVVRGGSWLNRPELLRSAFRGWFGPVSRYSFIGFRVALPG